jgi:hypothetical protein
MALALILVGLLVMLALVLLDLHRRSLRTLTLQVPGGLRFEAQSFSVQVQRTEQELHVCCQRGRLSPPASDAAQAPVSMGSVACTFAAMGVVVEVRDGVRPGGHASQPMPSGYCDIVVRGSDGTQLVIERIPDTVAASFKQFFLQVRVWINKLEQRAERARIERLRSEEDTAQAQQHADLLLQLRAGQAAGGALSPAECEAMAQAQIAMWRQAAGFGGLHSLQHTDAAGVVTWFVDLAADGRITLHADHRTIHSTLQGASIAANNGALDVGVKDAHWTEAEPQLRVFQILKGRSADERRAWKERLEIVRNSLAKPASKERQFGTH